MPSPNDIATKKLTTLPVYPILSPLLCNDLADTHFCSKPNFLEPLLDRSDLFHVQNVYCLNKILSLDHNLLW